MPAKSYNQQMIDLKEKYKSAGQKWPARAREVAAWAVYEGHWDQQPKQKIDACAREMAEAFRKNARTDPQGRLRVRTMSAAPRTVINDDGKPEQIWFWDEVDTASHEHNLAAFRARHRDGKEGACSLQNDIASFNENHLQADRSPIEFDFDFTLEPIEETAPA